jgi:SAM-dependent methyltransferase
VKTDFKDNFSVQAASYAKFRPRYPDSLFRYLAGLCQHRRLAWDCGTGNGQCAVSLTKFFDQVIATDASQEQLDNAEPHHRIQYRRARAEESGMIVHSTDLITVAQALHWFRIDEFWNEVRRVLHPNGVVAVWCYKLLKITPEIDAVVNRFYRETVGPYWDFERTLVEDGYQSVPFPFVELQAPSFAIEASWTLGHLLGFLQSWSATQKFLVANAADPVRIIAPELSEAWGDSGQSHRVKWPLKIRVGRKTPRNS